MRTHRRKITPDLDSPGICDPISNEWSAIRISWRIPGLKFKDHLSELNKPGHHRWSRFVRHEQHRWFSSWRWREVQLSLDLDAWFALKADMLTPALGSARGFQYLHCWRVAGCRA